ncbi:exopolysaccharide biosynthesis protein [Sagittula stellata]|uniref:nucleotide-binding protein n=1 Tax=Sagittula stellata TaxID=52603 RepID=UPI003218FDF9
MNMMDSRKFRRKRKPLTTETPSPQEDASKDMAPVPPLETREERLARRAREEGEGQTRPDPDAARQARAREAARIAAAAARQKAEAESKAQADAQRRAEEQAHDEAEAEAQRQAEEQARAKAEAEAQRQAEEQAHAEAEAEAQRRAEEQARAEAEAEAQRQAEEQARAKAEAEAQRQAEEQARAKAEAEAQRQAEEQARAKAEAEAQRQAEEQARAEAEAEAQRQAEEQARTDAETEGRRRKLAEARQAAKLRRAEEARRAAEADADDADDEDEDGTAEQADTPVARPAPAMPTLALTPEQRSPAADQTPLPQSTRLQTDTAWRDLPVARFELSQLNRHRVVTADRLDPAHATFDVLRTRLMHTLSERGWKRVAVTSPGKGCGKTFTVANLAISLSRQENTRTLVMDFDMRRPSLHRVLGVDSPGPIGDVLRGKLAPEDHLIRLGENDFNAGHNIAFGLNTVTEAYASELLQDPRTRVTLDRIEEELRPDVVLFDLPPALSYDDVIAFQPLFDGVLLVVGGGLTTEREVKEVERRLGTETPLLGMILNKAEGVDVERYAY